MTAPQRFRSRPQTVEAVQWRGEENCEEVFAFLGLKHPTDAHTNHAWIEGLNGDPRVVGNPGDWIVRHGEDRFEVLTDAEFRAAYDPELTERQHALLDAIRHHGGDWTPARAVGALQGCGWSPTPARGAQIMKELADLGYLEKVRARAYTYRLKVMP